MSRDARVAEGYAALMGKFALPLFLTQTFPRGGPGRHQPGRLTVAWMIGGSRYARGGTHPEGVVKAHRHTLNLLNRELHGNNWQRRGIVGCQSVLGVERHKSGDPHSHAVIGHPDIDLGAPEQSPLRRALRLTCEAEWGFAKLEVAKSPEHCNAYVSKYVMKDGEVTISDHLEALATGALSTAPALPFGAEAHRSAAIGGGRAPTPPRDGRPPPQAQESWCFVLDRDAEFEPT